MVNVFTFHQYQEKCFVEKRCGFAHGTFTLYSEEKCSPPVHTLFLARCAPSGGIIPSSFARLDDSCPCLAEATVRDFPPRREILASCKLISRAHAEFA